MSDRRKSSAPLSSRTQQRALEDEEEQEREHRRRLWNLRFTTDDEDLPAPERWVHSSCTRGTTWGFLGPGPTMPLQPGPLLLVDPRGF
ncbi:hypothetical protein CapIbe_024102 [Capra ibex]